MANSTDKLDFKVYHKNGINNILLACFLKEDNSITYNAYTLDGYEVTTQVDPTHELKTTNINYTTKYRKVLMWDFGDGTRVEGYSASHHYKYPGKYTIKCYFIDIDHVLHENGITKDVYVLEAVPTQIRLENTVSDITCSHPTKIAEMTSTLSSLVVNTPQVKIDRVYGRNSKKDTYYFDIESDPYIHLQNYWALMEETITKDYSGKWESILKETEDMTMDYYPIYCYFDYETNSQIPCFLTIDSYKKTGSDWGNFWSKYLLNNKAKHKKYVIKSVSHISELEDYVDKGLVYAGRIAKKDVYFKSDFVHTSSDKVTLSFHFDTNKMKLADTGARYDDYVNMPPLGLEFTVASNVESGLKYILTMNGIISNTDELIDKNTQNVLDPPYMMDEKLRNYININIPVNIIAIPYKIVTDCKLCHYYIPKDLMRNEWKLVIDGEEYAYTKDGGSCYSQFTVQPTKKKMEYRLAADNKDRISKRSINIKDYNEVVIPKEKYSSEDFDRLLNAYTPHPMFMEADNMKDFFRTTLASKNFFNYVLTRIDSFFDDHSNVKLCYINQLISFMTMMGVDLGEYGYTNFEGVNELRDFTRILSINHPDLVGQLKQNELDITITQTYTGKNVGMEVLPEDSITFNEKGNITKVVHEGKTYNISAENGTKLIVRDNYTNTTRIVDFYQIKDKRNKAFKINTNYTEDLLWNLLLPTRNGELALDQVNGYYSFYLLIPNIDYTRQYNFLDESTITQKVQDSNKWEEEYGVAFDCLNKIIIESLFEGKQFDDSTIDFAPVVPPSTNDPDNDEGDPEDEEEYINDNDTLLIME